MVVVLVVVVLGLVVEGVVGVGVGMVVFGYKGGIGMVFWLVEVVGWVCMVGVFV